jgi:hypothetical protein
VNPFATDEETVAIADAIATVSIFKRPSRGWKTTGDFNAKLGGENGFGYGSSLAVGGCRGSIGGVDRLP